MKNVSRVSCLVAGVLALGCGAVVNGAITTELDSAAFPYAYEGDAITIDGVNGSGFGNTGYSGVVNTDGITTSSDGNIFTMTTSAPFGGVFQSSVWPSVATHEAGWTWEMRFSVEEMTGNFYAMLMRIGATGNTSAATGHDFFYFKDSSLSSYSGTVNLPIVAGQFYTLRVAQAANSSEFNVWFDGELVAAYTMGTGSIPEGIVGPYEPWFGDGSGDAAGTVAIDHIRFTNGGYAPVAVPEPASLSLIGLAALATLRRRRS